ncbi:YdiU family protein [Flavobacterium sp.]|uniref:protein adenylyltransferase SelO n=1 Tax=Flavobacterium sp. TaxID=239 RepID=UPI0035271C99
MNLPIQNRFITELPSDKNTTNEVRQVHGACFSFVNPTIPKKPKLIHTSIEVASLLGISKDDLLSDEFLNVFSGKTIYPKTQPFAMNYAGQQFGNWAGQLGDGRAINLFEVGHQNKFWTVQLKGAGKTPYSRRGDGLAVLRSSIREHLCSEAMHHLGISTTRSLALFETGNEVLRDVLYNGNAAYEKGAIVCRVAPSFIRFGNFELFAAQNDIKNLKKLTDFTIKHYFPNIKTKGKQRYLDFFSDVCQTTKAMILDWQRVGFVHGVMNTDNMSILGLTIDYGPYGWQDDYNPNWTPNTTDAQEKRYRFGNQPNIALWNLLQLANALYPLIEDAKALEHYLEVFSNEFQSDFMKMMATKIGIENTTSLIEKLLNQLLITLQETETDMTIFYRLLATVSKNDTPEIALEKIQFAFYKPEEVVETVKQSWLYWFTLYLNSLQKETASDEERSNKMNLVNPKYVLRNYMAQLAIEAAEKEDYTLVNELFELLKKPYNEQPQHQKWFAKRPTWARTKIGCSMLSCSS